MQSSDRKKSDRILLASPWLLATASLLLALIIVIFAVNNFQREKKLMNMALVQEGRTVLNLVSSSSRAALRNLLREAVFSSEIWIKSVQEIIENGSEHQGIISLSLVDRKGLIVAHNQASMVGKQVDESTIDFLYRIGETPEQVYNSRTLPKASGESQRFQIASLFNPLEGRNEFLSGMKDNPRGRMGRMMRDQVPPHEVEMMLRRFPEKTLYLVAELDMTAFQHQVRKQFVYIVILSIVLLLVGVGGLLSLAAIQGFRGSQQKLKTITAFTDLLIASMPLGVIALDSGGTVKTCNGSASAMLDFTSSVTGKRYAEIFPEKIITRIDSLISRKNVMSETDVIVEKQGNSKTLHVMCVPISSVNGAESGQMLLIQDLTMQKNLESELRRNERHTALGKMAAGVAHELRNPLSSIKGLALLLKSKTDQPSGGAEAADILISEVERLDRSISELLDYSRPEHLSVDAIELAEPIKKAIRLIHSDANAENIRIIEKYDESERLIQGDRDKLTQLFLNLFLNSIQAMTGGGYLTVATHRDDDKMVVSVEDSGTGIDEAIKEKIFDPYFTTKNEGTGLGLSLCRKIVEDHHGSITIDSVNGRGTKVVIVFPRMTVWPVRMSRYSFLKHLTRNRVWSGTW